MNTTKKTDEIAEQLAESKLRHKICISGAAETSVCSPDMLERTQALGRCIAERGMITVTGATTGAPYWAAKGAKMAGGIVIGFSPAATKLQHAKSYKLPLDYHDIIVYTGFGYSGRNLILTRASDAVISVCGRIGTLNEFTNAFEDGKIQGVLLNVGGTTDLLPQIIEKAGRGTGKIVVDHDPENLVKKLMELIEEEEKEAMEG